MTRRATAALVAAAGLLAGMAAGAAPAATAPAGQPTDRELSLMPLPRKALGRTATGLRLDGPDSGYADNARTAEATLDPDDTPGDLAAAGHVRGYRVRYLQPALASLVSGHGVIEADTSVELFGTQEQATRFLDRQASDYGRLAGREVAAATTLVRSRTFAVVDTGDAATGVVGEYRLGRARAWTTTVQFRLGPLVGEIAISRADASSATDRTRTLAHALERRIRSVLAGVVREQPSAGNAAPAEPVAKAPEGIPDLSRIALPSRDLPPGFRVQSERFLSPARDVVAFQRTFHVSPAPLGDARLFTLATSVVVFPSAAELLANLNAQLRAYGGPDGAAVLGRAFGGFGGGRIVATRQPNAGTILIEARFPSGFTDVTGVLALVAVGDRAGTLTVTAPAGHLDIADVAPLARRVGARLAGAVRERGIAL